MHRLHCETQGEMDFGQPDYILVLQKYEGADPDHVRLDPREAAILTGQTEKTLEGWRTAGKELPFLKLGRRIRYRLSDVLDFINRNRFASTREAKTRDRAAPCAPSKRRARG